MSTDVIRILSDLHYGDRGSRIRTLSSLTPLFEGAGSLVLNGDTLDCSSRAPIRPGTAALRSGGAGFFFVPLRATHHVSHRQS